MFRRYVDREKEISAFDPPFSNDSRVIRFRLWTALLSLEGYTSEEIRRNETILFLNEEAESWGAQEVTVTAPLRLMNPTRFSNLNLAIVFAGTGKEVFTARELPAGKFLHLEFLKEGAYTLHYWPAFSQAILRRSIRAVPPTRPGSSPPHNFHPRLKPKRWR